MKFVREIDINKPYAFSYLCNYIDEAINKFYDKKKHCDIVIACIGTDRATGDCLGPLVGYKLNIDNKSGAHVYGTLENPLHAKNLNEHLQAFQALNKPFVIAIDACLGKHYRIGQIVIQEGPLLPGSGVGKDLPPVGDINITGIVNMGGFMEIMILQNTRLSIVMNMANMISGALRYCMWKFNRFSGVSLEMAAESEVSLYE